MRKAVPRGTVSLVFDNFDPTRRRSMRRLPPWVRRKAKSATLPMVWEWFENVNHGALHTAGYNECVTPSKITTSDDTPMSKIFHPLLALIASATDKEII